MILLWLFVAVLITWHITELITHSKILKTPRVFSQYVQEFCDDAQEDVPTLGRIISFLTIPIRAINCPFCLSHWVGAAVVFTMEYLDCWSIPLAALMLFPTIRLANLCNDLLWKWTRTPGRSDKVYLHEASDEAIETAYLDRFPN